MEEKKLFFKLYDYGLGVATERQDIESGKSSACHPRRD